MQDPNGIIEWTERQILSLKTVDIPQHLMFRMIAIEHLVGEIRAGAGEIRRETCRDAAAQVSHLKRQPIMADKNFHQAMDFVFRAHLIQRNPDGVVLISSKIDAGFVGPDHDGFGLHLRQTNPNRIEVGFCCDLESELPQSCCQHYS